MDANRRLKPTAVSVSPSGLKNHNFKTRQRGTSPDLLSVRHRIPRLN